MRFLRFVVDRRNEDSGVREGIFQAASRLSRSAALPAAEEARLRAVERWFSENLPKPDRFTRTRNDSHKRTRGIAWFKDSASEHLRQARIAVSILEKHGVFVETIETERPGYTVYEDEFQVVAEPFTDTGA